MRVNKESPCWESPSPILVHSLTGPNKENKDKSATGPTKRAKSTTPSLEPSPYCLRNQGTNSQRLKALPVIRRGGNQIQSNLFKSGNGKRDADCAENQLFCTYVNILLSCKPVCIPFSTCMYTFFPRQPVCKGPLYRFYRAAVSRASNPLFDLFLVLVDPWSRGPVHPWARGARGPEDPWSHSCSNMLIAV